MGKGLKGAEERGEEGMNSLRIRKQDRRRQSAHGLAIGIVHMSI